MVWLAFGWIVALLLLGGFALDRVLVGTLTRNFDAQLSYALTAMIASADLDASGEVRFTRPLGDQRFSEPYSGLYWQVNAAGQEPFRSRSLWDRALAVNLDANCVTICSYRTEGRAGESLRVVERDARLPGTVQTLRFQVAQATDALDAQVRRVRSILWWSLGAVGAGLFLLAALQAVVGLLPLRRMSATMADIRAGRARRAPTEDVPPEIAPLVGELNDLLDHNEKAAEAARMHAGNLAHALKTPMSVLMNEASAGGSVPADAITRELTTMRRHIDHHLARARAAGRRSAASARAEVWPALEGVRRAVEQIHEGVAIDLAGDRQAVFRGERQDLEEMAGNLIDNAANYGGGRVFVTVSQADGVVEILVEDDGQGIPEAERTRLFERGARLDTGRPGTGLGLAIVRDVAEIYGGSVTLGESEDLGGLAASLKLPGAVG
ncbi:HAMP domain-containing histidine kinase [Sandaracinobacteroides saxicola]|uniref:histidine kinase n=1 Tax=Sandaracinobacteroides saxicola TaxID=2759707 RepID=A0A7G5IMN0_9SPHN|nr:HAMP domain-containing histidine kinase [Sandaracinobacteroides saxicola]